jgi:hypothetical protein
MQTLSNDAHRPTTLQPDPFARLVEIHDQMRSLAPANATRPADYMSKRARQVWAFDEIIIRVHKETP